MFERVAVVGTGIVGRGWIRVFCEAGCQTAVFDKDATQLKRSIEWFNRPLEQDVVDALPTAEDARRQRNLLMPHHDLAEALDGCGWIQESTPENLEIKRAVFAEMDRLADGQTIIATSSSGLDIDQIVEGLSGADRCVLAHPYNPPFVIPVVEVLPVKGMTPEGKNRVMSFLKSVGQVPVMMNFYLPGFLGNRIQVAIAREAIHLVESGVADVEAVDAVICHGLGLRYALLGNFGVNHTNADGGIREYYHRYGKAYVQMINTLDNRAPSFDEGMIEKIARGADELFGSTPVEDLCRWRDRMARKIRRCKHEDPQPRVKR